MIISSSIQFSANAIILFFFVAQFLIFPRRKERKERIREKEK
jgi:hypothetical protein